MNCESYKGRGFRCRPQANSQIQLPTPKEERLLRSLALIGTWALGVGSWEFVRGTVRPMSTLTRTQTGRGSVRLVAFASLIGTTIEWYDFFLYGTAAALVFNRLFFPNSDPLMGTLYSFGTYAVGFFARPIGGIVIGHYGDRVGRKSMLVLTLVIMGVATALIGVLPTYQQIGPWAAVLLIVLRVAQGFGVGGEWGGAVLMAVEHAPDGRRGFYGSWPQVGVPAGLVLSTAVFTVFSRLPEDQFLRWGWRVPFLLSALLVIVGLLIRMRILETPAFAKLKESSAEARQPILEVISRYPRQVILAMGARFAENGAFYIYSVFALVYATQQVKMPQQTILYAACLSLRCHRHRRARLPAVLAARHRIGGARRARDVPRLHVLARADVRTAGRVSVRTVRYARPLQRRIARCPAFVSAGRRAVAVHRHMAAAQLRAQLTRDVCHLHGPRDDRRGDGRIGNPSRGNRLVR